MLTNPSLRHPGIFLIAAFNKRKNLPANAVGGSGMFGLFAFEVAP
jgi:hypothetical protein